MFINIRINKTFSGYAEGRVVAIQVDQDGTPLQEEWRRRLKDAALDGCCEVIQTPKAKRAPANTEKAEG